MKYQLIIKVYQGKVSKGSQGCKFEADSDAKAIDIYNHYRECIAVSKPFTHVIISLKKWDRAEREEVCFAVVRAKKC